MIIACSPSEIVRTSQNPHQACSASPAANPTATDNCGQAAVAYEPAVIALGTTAVSYSAADASGNAAHQSP